MFEYINYSANQYLNTDKTIIQQRLSSFKKGLDQELKESQATLASIESLKEKLFEFEQLRYVVPLYLKKEIFQRDVQKQYLISEDELAEMCSNQVNKASLEADKKSLTETIEELIRSQDQKGTDQIKNEIARIERYFTDNNLDSTNLQKALTRASDKKDSRQVDLTELKESLYKDDLEISMIFRSITRDITSPATSLKRELEIEVEFNKEKTLYDSSSMQLKKCQGKLKEANEEYQNFFNHAFHPETHDNGHLYTDIDKDPEEGSNSLKSRWQSAKISFEGKYELIVQGLEDGTALKGSYNVGQLAHRLLPTVFTSAKAVENESVEVLLAEKLDYLHQSIREIGSRKLEILKKVFTEVNQTYREYLIKITEIDNYFKDPQKRITGGNKASLTINKSTDYPAHWMSVFNKTLTNQLSYIGMFESLTQEIDINEMMKAAFVSEGGTKNASIEDLLNPKSYFDLEFKLKLESGEDNSGSNSQAYSGYALLGLARLSLIEDKRPGIKIMPIDEAQGLGSNYEMLRDVALDEGYQILSMSIDSAGELREGEQYIYMLSENRLQDQEHYVPAMAIFTEGQITPDINQFINDIEDENT